MLYEHSTSELMSEQQRDGISYVVFKKVLMVGIQGLIGTTRCAFFCRL